MRIVLSGGMAAMPVAGVAWQVLHHLEGLRRLGHEVFYIEDTERWPYDPINDTVCDTAQPAARYLAATLPRAGIGPEAWAYRDVASGMVLGAGEHALRTALAGAEILINLSGMTVLREEHLEIPTRLYLETDPVQPQIEVASGNARTIALLDAHTHHATYGANFGARDCGVPLGRYRWIPTRPPVILDWWATGVPAPQVMHRFTTVANWRQTGHDLTWRGRRLTWSKDIEFNRVLALPEKIPGGASLELCLAVSDHTVVETLHRNGWRVRPAQRVSRDPVRYAQYIRSSSAEFSVAKEQNVALRSGWFSDRTASYLAAGRPAVVQDTGFGASLPVGEGLIGFTDLTSAADAIGTVIGDYARHSRAASEIANDRLRAESVLTELLRAL
jgi:hypothetical protein